MKMSSNILRFFVTLVILHNLFEVDGKNIPTESKRHEQRLANGTKSCSRMGMYCDSCTDAVMCIKTETYYGWTEQHVQTCDSTETCLNGKCTTSRNIFCDGTTNIPFQCHTPGAFPDPFDCQSYHLCVLNTNPINKVQTLKDFNHTCDYNYRYDPKSTYCKYRMPCRSLPVPICKYPGHTEALEENDSIFFICEEIGDILYPHLYACPHGEQYVAPLKTCGLLPTTEPPMTTPTTEPPMTTPTTEGSTYEETTPEAPTSYSPTYSWIVTDQTRL